MQKLTYGTLDVTVEADDDAVGAAAGADFASAVNSLLATRPEISVVMATGNSQRSFREAVIARDDIDWSRITIFHLDEYLGVPADRPESTVWRMRNDIVDRVHPRAFHPFQGEAEPAEEIARYSRLLREQPPAICILGVGENGHMAFNDPPADFETDELVIEVELSEASKQQIMGEGRFAGPGETVPSRALTMTVRALLAPEHVIVVVPEGRKAAAIKAALEGPVTPDCPGSILQETPNARMYLDADSAALLEALR